MLAVFPEIVSNNFRGGWGADRPSADVRKHTTEIGKRCNLKKSLVRNIAAMNAAEQAISLETTSKIAAIVNLFKQEFPDANADLKPWMNDPDTRELVDPHSIDIGFHFPGWSPRFQSRSILVQIRLHPDPEATAAGAMAEGRSKTIGPKSIGAEMVGFTHTGKQWHLSTIQDWTFEGAKIPNEPTQFQLKRFCRKLLEVFNG
jgi:hypothetical protein